MCRLLESGKNVATVSFLFHPRRIADDDRRRLLAACDKGNSTIHGSGLNPGNLSGVLPLALSGMSRTIERFTLQERADWSLWESTDITFDGMWFGRPVAEVTPTANDFLAFNSSLFTEQTWFIADTLHANIDEVTVNFDAVPAKSDHKIFDHLVQAGTQRDNAGTGRANATGAADRVRDAVDRRGRIPRPLAQTRRWVDADARR